MCVSLSLILYIYNIYVLYIVYLPIHLSCSESATLNMLASLENSAVTIGLENVSFISIPKKGDAKDCSSNCRTALISHAGKLMLKILQARLQ